MEQVIRNRSYGKRLRLRLLGDVLPTTGMLLMMALAMVWWNG